MREEYANIIDKLDEYHFNEFVRLYLQLYYNTPEVNICNGPWDGGNDACFYCDGRQVKRNIQITVQNKIDKKIYDDIQKSRDNAENYHYASRLDFFYSHPLSHSTIVKYEDESDQKFGISLRILDANKLGDDVSRYPELHDFLYRIIAPKCQTTGCFNIDRRRKLLYDSYIMGNNASMVKENIIVCFVLWHLFQRPGCSKDDLCSHVSSALNITPDRVSNLLGTEPLSSSVVCDETGSLFLTLKAKTEITHKLELADMNEAELLSQVESFLVNHGLVSDGLPTQILQLLHSLYEVHYSAEVDEFDFKYRKKLAEREISGKLHRLFEKTGYRGNINELVESLIEISAHNEFLNKISASNFFVNLYKNRTLEKYMDISNCEIMLDTQILIRILCLNYKNVENISPMFDAVRFLMDVLDSIDSVRLQTTYAYAEELASTLYEAKMLSRFLDMSFVSKLGRSKNAFFNYYRFLESQGLGTFESFDDFIQDLLGLDEYPSDTRANFISGVSFRIMELLEYEGVELHDIRPEDCKEYANWRRKYDLCLDSIQSKKFDHARENDLLCLLYLADKSKHVNPDTNLEEFPYLVTWDSSSYPARQLLFKDFSHGRFFLYTPYKLANRLSLLSFRLNAQNLSREIISLINPSFETSSGSISFIDMISSLFPNRDIPEGKMATKLANLREELFDNYKEHDLKEESEKSNPLDNILYAVVKFANNKGKSAELTATFENPDMEESISESLSAWCNLYKQNASIPQELYKKVYSWISK